MKIKSKNKLWTLVIIAIIIMSVVLGNRAINGEITLTSDEGVVVEKTINLSQKDQEAPQVIKVHITGAVISPGVYEMSSDDRIDDLVKEAGGFSTSADESYVNLAEKLTDGQKIIIPKQGETVNYLDDGFSFDDINYLSESELQQLDGIGEVLAKRIIDYRENNGYFKSKDDLLLIEGIGEKKLEMIMKNAK